MRPELILMRHAKSSWSHPGLSDFERPLNSRGKKDAPRMGRWLADHDLAPDWIISSPASRAGKTALAVCEACGFDPEHVHWDERIYLSSVSTMIEVLSECPDSAQRVLLVGHNPGMEGLLEYLAGRDVEPYPDGKLMPTAAVAHLELATDWRSLSLGSASLQAGMRPGLLRDGA